ncbi:unnamed protein product [Clonostachys rosea f. rosea IK726]|uniref:BZIP domain-containing protein n=2 Tax=Bionectria ochroleuca TaxID=29856 RepID=A0A0B7KSC1_BIOOC|nr:unnamed protein product [Clonostachys rosea f. rosea IK726]
MTGCDGSASDRPFRSVGAGLLAIGHNDRRGLPMVRLEEMAQQTGLLKPEEDWTGVSDPKMRRRLQNRINYRAWKRRQNMRLYANGSTNTSSVNETTSIPLISMTDKLISTLCSSSLVNIEARMDDFERAAVHAYTSGSPRIDLLFNLTQFNVMRGLFINMAAIGYNPSLFTDASGTVSDTAISPLTIPGATPAVSSMTSHLRPTSLQLTVKHHPWIDLWPFPAMRDNILSRGEEYDDTELCLDLVENYCGPSGMSGFRVWGDPWSPENWEISEEFLMKWGWVVAGCSELLIATDYWRERRGEPALFRLFT